VVFFAQTVLFLIGALGLGMVISAAAKTQFLATQIALIATLLPSMLLSGFLFEIAAMPPALQVVSFAVPARYYVVVARGIMLKGVGPEVLWIQSLFMVLFALVGFALAMRVFRKEIA
jgi:ABC-2 type transport system permease protein